MTNKELADLLFPNVKLSVDEIFKRYPSRSLQKGAQVTRFAPSPTGLMHMGGFFQTLIDRTIAKNTNGVFYLRNEDTDSKRKVDGAAEAVFDLLCKFGQKPDEYQLYGEEPVGNYGPYIQSQRTEIYQAFAKKLVAEGKAFPCFCKKTEGIDEILKDREERYSESSSNLFYDNCRNLTPDEAAAKIKNGEKFAIRLKTQNNGTSRVEFLDVIKGKLSLPENARDVIIIKNDGIPPYAFAHAVDDTLMGTTLVVRGEEWLSSTPEHIEIFNALGFKVPIYCHTPLIWKNDENGNKRKISKRHDPEFFMQYFLEKGYPAMAVVEYLLNLINSGFEKWRTNNPNAPLSDFKFGINQITTASPLYDQDKFVNVSKNVIARMSAQQLYTNWLEWSKEYDKKLCEKLQSGKDYFIKVCAIGRDCPKPRKDIYCYSKISEQFDYMIEQPKLYEIDKEELKNFTEFVKSYGEGFVLNHDKNQWFDEIKKLAEKLGYATDNKDYKAFPEKYKGNVAKACEFLRIALTGHKDSPDLHEIMLILGEDEIKNRFQKALEKYKK